MVRVINGKRYSTETAELVYRHGNGFNSGDFQYRAKKLYRTAKGAWFLHHIGGAASDMAMRSQGNTMVGGEDIEPISDEDALKFLERHDGTEEIARFFADRVQDA